MLRQRQPRIKDEKHRKFVASLPCCVSGVSGQTQAAHVKTGALCGMGMKPSDAYIVPLSCREHAAQHKVGERVYWGDKLEAAQELCNALYLCTGNYDKAHVLLARFMKK